MVTIWMATMKIFKSIVATKTTLIAPGAFWKNLRKNIIYPIDRARGHRNRHQVLFKFNCLIWWNHYCHSRLKIIYCRNSHFRELKCKLPGIKVSITVPKQIFFCLLMIFLICFFFFFAEKGKPYICHNVQVIGIIRRIAVRCIG